MSAIQFTWNLNTTDHVPPSIADVSFQVYVAHSRTNEVLCGASILSSLVILTAASCLAGRNAFELTVVAGDQHFSKKEGSKQIIPLVSFLIHEGFNFNVSPFENNLAVGFLSSHLTFNRYVAPIKFYNETRQFKGNGTISSWRNSIGSDSHELQIQLTSIPIIPVAECARLWNMERLLSDKFICVNKTGNNSCEGDTGGPLTGTVDGVPMLLGVATGGIAESCELKNKKPRIYINVAQYGPWINQTTLHFARVNSIKCTKGQFKCPISPKCIPNSYVCDGDNDCGNNEDESNCTLSFCTEMGKFMCPNSTKCISNGFVCDGDKDCENNEDEMNCNNTTCTALGRFWCANSSICIRSSYFCDGFDNCGNYEDEINCNKTTCTNIMAKIWCPGSSTCVSTRSLCHDDDDSLPVVITDDNNDFLGFNGDKKTAIHRLPDN